MVTLSDNKKSNYALAVSYIVTELIQAYEAGEQLNFTACKGQAAKKFQLTGIPKMADILQALPIQYKAKLWPYLKTKPVRTASGGKKEYKVGMYVVDRRVDDLIILLIILFFRRHRFTSLHS
jgi:hypothetical protein